MIDFKEVKELKESIEYLENMIKTYENELEKTNDVKYAGYLECEVERMRDTLIILEHEYKEACGLLFRVTFCF